MNTNNYIAKGEGADRYEKVPVRVYGKPSEAVKAVAREIADLIRSNAAKAKCVLGLATGSSPIKLYQELRMHKEEGLSFKNVVTFNSGRIPAHGEGVGHSYHYFMHHHLFDHIDIDPANIHIPDGTLQGMISRNFAGIMKAIENAGGIDLQILGIGRTGHIGFNEPGSLLSSPDADGLPDDLTIKDAASDFGGGTRCLPCHHHGRRHYHERQGKIILMAWGEKKAPIIKSNCRREHVGFGACHFPAVAPQCGVFH